MDGFVEKRTHYAAIYNQAFSALEEVEIPPVAENVRHAWHLYVLRLNLDLLRVDRREFIQELRRKGVGASVHFIPIPLHPYFAKMPLAQGNCARALNLYPRIVSLPLYPALTEEQVHYVADCVKDVLVSSRKRGHVALPQAG